MRSWPKTIVLFVAATAVVYAVELPVKFVFPAGAQVGTQTTVSCSLGIGEWPVAVWADDPGLKFKPTQTNGVFELEVDAATSVGPHLIRFHGKETVSDPIQFVVSRTREITASTHSNVHQLQLVDSFPIIINGLISITNHSQTYILQLPEACQLEAFVCATGLDSPVTPALELLDSSTNRIAFSEPVPDREATLSCFLASGGTYLLRVLATTNGTIPANLQKQEVGVYRLTLSAAVVPSTVTTKVESARGVQTVVDMFRPMVAVRTLMIPSVTRGVIAPAGREINYGFETRGLERFRFRVRAESVGSPLRPRLRILDPGMNLLAEAHPGGDVELVWVSPAEGSYIAAVSDVDGNGGPLFSFQLEVDPPDPFFRATVGEHTYRLKPGETCSIGVRLLRPGTSTSILQVVPVGLPDGVTCIPQTADAGTKDLTLELNAASNVTPTNMPFVLSVFDFRSTPPQIGQAVAPLVGRYAPRGKLLINETAQLWLTVTR